jgi:hypothetical protein
LQRRLKAQNVGNKLSTFCAQRGTCAGLSTKPLYLVINTVIYHHLRANVAPDFPVIQAPFLGFVVAEEPCSPEWRTAVSKWLVNSGCLYMVAWGAECSLWDDSVDWANIEAFHGKEIPEEHFVMTTWQADEPFSEAMSFAKNSALHGCVSLSRGLLLHISSKPNEAEMLCEFKNA